MRIIIEESPWPDWLTVQPISTTNTGRAQRMLEGKVTCRNIECHPVSKTKTWSDSPRNRCSVLGMILG
jgi:hypothetical protein